MLYINKCCPLKQTLSHSSLLAVSSQTWDHLSHWILCHLDCMVNPFHLLTWQENTHTFPVWVFCHFSGYNILCPAVWWLLKQM